MRKILILAFVFAAPAAYAQKAFIKKVELAGEKIIVYYDLEDGNPNNLYQITLYSSNNNFSSPLSKVSGDVGNDVKPGSGKKIIWNTLEDLGAYKGKLAIELRGKVHNPVVRLTNIDVGSKFKRGKSHTITWKPGNINAIHIELRKGGERISGELNQPNNGSFSLFIPARTALGKDYTIKITDSRNAEDIVVSKPFRVTAKVPLLFKVLPLAVVGGALVIIGGGGGGGGGTVVDLKLPPPPDPN